MEKFTVYTGKSVPLMNDNIDTDQLIPKQFLKAVDKKGFGKNLMFEWRYLNDDYEENPDFVFNNLSIAMRLFWLLVITLVQDHLVNTLRGHWKTMVSAVLSLDHFQISTITTN